MRLLIVLLLAGSAYSQTTTKLTKYLKKVVQGELTGIQKGDQWVVRPGYIFIDKIEFGIQVTTASNLIGLLSDKGDWILDTAYTDIQKIYDFYKKADGMVVQNQRNEMAYFSREGKLLIPFALQEFDCNNGFIQALQGDRQALYDPQGNVVVPIGEYAIDVSEPNSRTITIMYPGGKSKVLVDKNDVVPNQLARINAEFAMFKTEVSIYDYFLFLTHLKNEPGQLENKETGAYYTYEMLLPDTMKMEPKCKQIWREFIRELADTLSDQQFIEVVKNDLVTMDFYLPLKLTKEQRVLSNFPVTGVDYHSAACYVQWMNLVYPMYSVSAYSYMWTFALPSKEAWKIAAEQGLPPTMQKNGVLDSLNKAGCFLFNFANLQNCKSYAGYLKTSKGGGAAPVVSFNADVHGCYNFFGNVAEMTAESGVALGGSYFHAAKEASVNQVQIYSQSESWLGFRIMAIPQNL